MSEKSNITTYFEKIQDQIKLESWESIRLDTYNKGRILIEIDDKLFTEHFYCDEDLTIGKARFEVERLFRRFHKGRTGISAKKIGHRWKVTAKFLSIEDIIVKLQERAKYCTDDMFERSTQAIENNINNYNSIKNITDMLIDVLKHNDLYTNDTIINPKSVLEYEVLHPNGYVRKVSYEGEKIFTVRSIDYGLNNCPLLQVNVGS